jgi:peptidyl-dipeptidase A
LALDADSLEASWITALLDSLEKITEEPYQRALQRRGAETGRNQLQPWDLMWAGGNGLSQINRHFPVDSQISFLQAAMMSCGIDLQTLPIYWDVTALDDIPPLVRACIVRPGYDLRVRANLRPGFPTQSELARETGIAIQAAFVSQEEPLFACLIDDTWRRMAGLVFEEIVNRPEFLVNAAGVPPTAVEAYRQARYDQTVINWRYLLAGARFEYEAYLNPNRDLDKLWWDISERLLDLPRHDQLSPWASRVSLIEQPLASINRILGGLAAVQTLNFLQDHNQALLDVRTRSFLVQHYFRYGASADWRRLLSHATEQPLSHRALSDWLDAEAVQP